MDDGKYITKYSRIFKYACRYEYMTHRKHDEYFAIDITPRNDSGIADIKMRLEHKNRECEIADELDLSSSHCSMVNKIKSMHGRLIDNCERNVPKSEQGVK